MNVRIYGSLFVAFAIVPTMSCACSPPPTKVLVEASSVVVVGSGIFSHQAGGGTVAPTKFIKGNAPAPIRVDIYYSKRVDERYRGVMCPDFQLEGRQVGTFYLRRLKNGHFNVVSFQAGR